MNCPYPRCGNVFECGSECCSVCGRKILFCPHCRDSNRTSALYCQRCGEPLPIDREWPRFRRTPELDAFAPSVLEYESIDPARQFEPLWPAVLLGNGKHEVIAALAAEYGLIVVVSRQGFVYILNRLTGEPLAETRIADSIDSDCGPLIEDGTLVLTGNDCVLAFDLIASLRAWVTGRFQLIPKWERRFSGEAVVHVTAGSPEKTKSRSVLSVTQASGGEFHLWWIDMAAGTLTSDEPISLPGTVSIPRVDDAGNAFFVLADGIIRVDLGAREGGPIAKISSAARPEIPPAVMDGSLLFAAADGTVWTCNATGPNLCPRPLSDVHLFGLAGFAVSPLGIFVAHAKGLSKLSPGGQVAWKADPAMEGVRAAPLVAGHCGFGITQNSSTLYCCDFRERFLRFYRTPLSDDETLAAPAFAGGTVYSCSLHGNLTATRVALRNL
jgi:hypothetical protein